MKRMLVCGVLSGVLILSASHLVAQITTGVVSGTVTDETGGVLPGVTVVVRHLQTGATRTFLTDDGGRYSVPQLAPGDYEIRADLPGFKTMVRSGILLTVGREAVVNIVLPVGQISDEVVVKGEAPLVETTTTTLAGLVDDKKIRDLPLNGRSFTQLALLQTGVTVYGSADSNPVAGTGVKFSVNGGRPNNNNFMLDGVNIADSGGSTPGGATGQNLGVEAILEFSVLTNTYSAAFGRNSGGVINIVSKSGTNEWHGSIFEFHRNSALDAKNFFDRHDKKIPHFIRNQFGFAIGGPIQKDKTFIFGNYEGLRDRLGLTGVSVVPNALARQGLVPDAVTKELTNVGLHPKVAPYLKLYPLPNGRDFGDGTGELLTSPSQPTDEDYFTLRLDHQISSRHSVFARYNVDDASVLSPSPVLSFGEDFASRTHVVAIQGKTILSAAVLNTATFGFNRSVLNLQTVPLTAEASDSSLSFVPGQPFGRLQVTGLPVLGTVSPVLSAHNTFQYGDDLRWITGTHNVQLGTSIVRLQNNIALRGFGGGYGIYSFGGLVPLLQGRAIFFLGYPSTVTVPSTQQVVQTDRMRGWRQMNLAFYVQDDIKVSRNLTVNLGLRHESMTTISEVNGRESNLRDRLASEWSIGDPIFQNPGKLAIQPRLGIAWDPFGDGKTAVRAGFGIFHDILIGVNYTEPGASNFPWSVLDILLSPPAAAFPNAFAIINTRAPLTRVIHMEPGVKFPTRSHFNANVQRQLGDSTTLTVGYVGSQGFHLTRRADQNTAVPEIRSDGSKFFRAGLSRPNRNFDEIQTVTTDATSSYHSLQIGLSRRFYRGLQFQGSYTFSKSLDDYSQALGSEGRNAPQNSSQWDNRKAERSYSNWDVRNTFTSNFTLELPFGKDLRGLGKGLLSGWMINGILTFASGPPLTVVTGVHRSRDLSQSTNEHPNEAPGRSNNPVLGGPDRYYDPTAFLLPELGTYGRVSRNTVRGPGFGNVDFSVNKTFPLSENSAVEFRAEFFNILNRPNFGRPDGTLFTSGGGIRGSAGRIGSTVNTSRQIQFALRVTF